MSDHYKALLAQWRAAAAATRKEQQRISEAFDRHLKGEGKPPSHAEVEHLHKLRDIEAARLAATLDYVKKTSTKQ